MIPGIMDGLFHVAFIIRKCTSQLFIDPVILHGNKGHYYLLDNAFKDGSHTINE